MKHPPPLSDRESELLMLAIFWYRQRWHDKGTDLRAMPPGDVAHTVASGLPFDIPLSDIRRCGEELFRRYPNEPANEPEGQTKG
jgi:hypothetical protein